MPKLGVQLFAALGAIAMVTAFTPSAHAECSHTSGGALLGTIGGAVIGGLVGSTIGSGTGRSIAIGSGVLVGGLAGNVIGKELTCEDQVQVRDTTQSSLESKPTGEPAAWKNPDSGNSGTVTPTNTYQRADGRYCREFTQTITVNGQSEEGYGTACRQDDGTWEIQEG